MVGADSHRISRAPWYLGKQLPQTSTILSTGLSPSLVALSRAFDYRGGYSLRPAHLRKSSPTSLVPQRVQAYTTQVLGSSRFAHHYSGNHIRFLFLTVLRCFSSRRSLPYPIYSDKVD